MVAIDINGSIKTYNSIPKSWGNVIGVNYMTEAEQNAIGFYNVVIPDTKDSQELGDIYFDADNSVFTYSVENKTYTETLAELKEEKIAKLKDIYNGKLKDTDWIIIRDQELGQTTDQTILDERAQLRTDCATHEAAINAKTTKATVIDYNLSEV